MKVIVNEAGFYAGTWFEAGDKPQDMPDAVARQFLPPYGAQLSLPDAKRAAPKAEEKKAG
ncbi:MAG TPA: hypothetical protein VGV39_15075 [Mesorhizobium sp.]|jgi:hypothetical protein|uniref:hypothetical protein n=1 Tax=Mesorhizobium sp. TaxID=1871066 RepID=UPI002DDD4297|nr:hypothetical protein [Mesorhizobium sp.]HEV2504399.1 hypothetical protein [Mesorhizobium sp.]